MGNTGIDRFRHLKPPTTISPFGSGFVGETPEDFMKKNCLKCASKDNCSLHKEILDIKNKVGGEISIEAAHRIGFLKRDYNGTCLEFKPKNKIINHQASLF